MCRQTGRQSDHSVPEFFPGDALPRACWDSAKDGGFVGFAKCLIPQTFEDRIHKGENRLILRATYKKRATTSADKFRPLWPLGTTNVEIVIR